MLDTVSISLDNVNVLWAPSVGTGANKNTFSGLAAHVFGFPLLGDGERSTWKMATNKTNR